MNYAVRNYLCAFYGKISKHKHHLILKLGQINSKFEISMTETGCFDSQITVTYLKVLDQRICLLSTKS